MVGASEVPWATEGKMKKHLKDLRTDGVKLVTKVGATNQHLIHSSHESDWLEFMDDFHAMMRRLGEIK